MRVAQRRTVSKKDNKKKRKENHRSPQDGAGGTSGVVQVVLGVSIEGSRGSRIFRGRVVRRGSW